MTLRKFKLLPVSDRAGAPDAPPEKTYDALLEVFFGRKQGVSQYHSHNSLALFVRRSIVCANPLGVARGGRK